MVERLIGPEKREGVVRGGGGVLGGPWLTMTETGKKTYTGEETRGGGGRPGSVVIESWSCVVLGR